MRGPTAARARRMLRRARTGLRAWDEGAATAEFAVVLPVVVVMTALLLATARACIVQLECQDTAADVARALAVRGAEGSAVTGARPFGDGVRVSVVEHDDRYEVTATCPVAADAMRVLPVRVTGGATALKQDGADG